MSLLKVTTRNLHTSAAIFRGAVSHPGWFPRDHMPGRYPRTEEERRAAAIKYGLRPEDYKPHHPDDLMNHIGDYPDIGIVTYEQRDPYEPYSDQLYRRNWNEPVPRQFIRYRFDRWSYTGLDEEDMEFMNVIRQFCVFIVPFAIVVFLMHNNPEKKLLWLKQKFNFTIHPRTMPKEYPYDFYRAFLFEDPTKYPILNYSFEPAEEGFSVEEAEAKHPFNESSSVL